MYFKAGPLPMLQCTAGRRALLGTDAAQGCSCGCLVRNPFSGGCSQCKPDIQCRAASCSCPTGHVTNKWDKQEALERRFCAGNTCGPNSCCGGVRYGRQEGGTELLNIAVPTALACVSCTAGCGACASATAQYLMEEELKKQMSSILQALGDTAMDLGNAAAEWGSNLTEQLMRAVEAIVSDIFSKGRINLDGVSAIQNVRFGRCTLSIEPGMNTYSSKTCVYCCNCVNNLNAVRMYLAWRLDCRP